MKSIALLVALVAAAVADKPSFVPLTSVSAPVWEQFQYENDAAFHKVWVPSVAKKQDPNLDEDILAFKGVVANEEASALPAFVGDKGLVLKSPNAHHAISHLLSNPLDFSAGDKPLVVQFETKSQKEHECGGAYLKLLTHDASFKPEDFNDKTPYTIMFGPDKCGYTKKVHFIFRHQNPITGEIEEKHMTSNPEGNYEKKSSLYTLVVQPDNSFEIFVNNESVRKGSLLEDFSPAVNPPKEVNDPEDTKPEDWVEDEEIPDPDATKPEDWDEDAPMFIPDEDAVKPENWYDDEPATIPDPNSIKPADWNDEDDGDWIAPTVPNPKCKESGCGEWKRPNKRNPDYKGTWSAPMIKNPDYKGPWSPKKIPNPAYFEDKHPARFSTIGALGFELWTVQASVLFDNLYVGHSVEDAKKIAEETWKPKFELESEADKEEVKKQEEEVKTDLTLTEKVNLVVDTAKIYYEEFLIDLGVFMKRVQQSPVDAIKEMPHVVMTVAATLFALFLPFLVLGSSRSSKKKAESNKKVESPKKAESPKKTESVKDDETPVTPSKSAKKTEESPKKNEEDSDASTTRPRRTRSKKDE